MIFTLSKYDFTSSDFWFTSSNFLFTLSDFWFTSSNLLFTLSDIVLHCQILHNLHGKFNTKSDE